MATDGGAARSFREHEFKVPERLVKKNEDMQRWESSQAYSEFMGFVTIVNGAVRGLNMKEDVPCSPAVDKLLSLISKLSHWAKEIPLSEESHQRFGNKAFKTWWEKVGDNASVLIGDLLPEDVKGAVVELEVYFRQSFGNSTRIDYGTGHEFKFCAFLCCLVKLGVLCEADAPAIALRVLRDYLELMRAMQLRFQMEPAGSHGVWGLDDFQFIPYIWGSSQLIGNPNLQPINFVDKAIAENTADEYLFMACVTFINTVKTGPFAEHSNTLWGISGLEEWTKVNSGLIKMYKAEVLGKFPVIQHFPFGTILTMDPPSG
ncbi:serine/threonine-protein phosphatase 2A activator-like [Halichondria panicea]|uniref:serine/threonine-protein phosphatase 2A activator-like n=1 Tax=Halichondria panicea TaxID=6063 RepID=UPI00312B5663